MQQPKSYSIFKETPQLLTRVIGQLFDDKPIQQPDHSRITLLNPQPVFQRRRFLRQAVDQHYQVTMQVVPAGQDGYPENIHGTVKALSNDKYLLSNHNVTYVVTFDQVRYIIHDK